MAGAPRLAVLGITPAGAQIRVAAERLRWRPAPADSADLVYVTAGAPENLTELAHSGAHIAIDVDLVAELGPEVIGLLMAESTGTVRRGEPMASSPAVRQWFQILRGTDGIGHLSGVSRSPSLASSLVVVALYASRLAGWGAVADIAVDTTRPRRALRIACHSGSRTRHVELDIDGAGQELPQWELQAASPNRVARVALLPAPRLEVNGEETAVPAEHPAAAFGQEAFLQSWWNAVRAETATRHDPDFVAALAEAVDLVRA